MDESVSEAGVSVRLNDVAGGAQRVRVRFALVAKNVEACVDDQRRQQRRPGRPVGDSTSKSR